MGWHLEGAEFEELVGGWGVVDDILFFSEVFCDETLISGAMAAYPKDSKCAWKEKARFRCIYTLIFTSLQMT